ncbi:hypothetical protein AWJ20_690 [Sugiyamaella lignohabitans]|uniref:Inositol polyphosphate-related phosphatase domain-containing protein n=1 Tax=Sugiyamaella lignohabitans TaxID=796027 RepID=A0A161HIP9_9ASCO|nr:uncharacterized protein AWJ20_690 [Sugiyamaella lignohabitans]ANB12437.1 hypothetical protein AWJ20_690 [Sugiyamaella lignohabitans]
MSKDAVNLLLLTYNLGKTRLEPKYFAEEVLLPALVGRGSQLPGASRSSGSVFGAGTGSGTGSGLGVSGFGGETDGNGTETGIGSGGSVSADSTENGVSSSGSSETEPEIVAIALEEVGPIMNGCFGDLDEYLSPILKGVETALDRYIQQRIESTGAGSGIVHHGRYIRVAVHSYGAIALLLYVFVPEGAQTPVLKVLTASTGVGYLRSSLKGGVGIRIELANPVADSFAPDIATDISVTDSVTDSGAISTAHSTIESVRAPSEAGASGSESTTKTILTFVAAHLTANEGMVYYRNRDFLDIVTMLDFGDGYGAYHPQSHLFFMGDLNYRSIEDPFGVPGSNTASNTASTTTHNTDRSEEETSLLSELGSSSNAVSRYKQVDELTIARRQGDAFNDTARDGCFLGCVVAVELPVEPVSLVAAAASVIFSLPLFLLFCCGLSENSFSDSFLSSSLPLSASASTSPEASVAATASDVASVAATASDVASVAASASDVASVAASASDVASVAASASDVASVVASASDVVSVLASTVVSTSALASPSASALSSPVAV